MVSIKIQKVDIACQNGLRLLSWEKGRYDVQIVTFARLKNAQKIADIEPPQKRMSPRYPWANANTYKLGVLYNSEGQRLLAESLIRIINKLLLDRNSIYY